MRTLPLATLCLAVVAPLQAAPPAGQALFTLGDVAVMDASGKTRPLKQGEDIQAGERVLTRPGALAQIRMPDGTRIGLRPDTDLRFGEAPADGRPDTLELKRGTVRMLSEELPGKGGRPITLQTPASAMKLTQGDTETVFNPPEAGRPAADQGSFHRLLSGRAELVLSPERALSLKPLEVITVADRSKPPLTLPSLPTGTPTFAPGESIRLAAAAPAALARLEAIDTGRLGALGQGRAGDIPPLPARTDLPVLAGIGAPAGDRAPAGGGAPVINNPPIFTPIASAPIPPRILTPIALPPVVIPVKYCFNPIRGIRYVC